jgi:REP element-mobilizing transposase RayT
MARPLRIQYPGAVYHVTCRGNERRSIFLDESDRLRFENLLAESAAIYQVLLYVYVMMKNHFHLVLQTKKPNLSEFMRRFNICYTSWFNHHHNRCGHLYQGRYNALLIDADSYLLEVSRYGHLNPVRQRKFRKWDDLDRWQYICNYRWSSLPGYLNEKDAVSFIDYSMILGMIGDRHAYKGFLKDALRGAVDNPFDKVKYQTILGNSSFVERVKTLHIEQGSTREQPMYRKIKAIHFEPSELLTRVAKAIGIEQRALGIRSKNSIERAITAEMLYRYSNATQSEIGKLLGGVDYTTVSRLRSRLQEWKKKSSKTKRKYLEIEKLVINNQE